MMKQSAIKESSLIKAEKVFDWVSRKSETKFTKLLLKRKKLMTDEISGEIFIPSEQLEPVVLWEGDIGFNFTGTITIQNDSKSETNLEVLINDSLLASIERQQSRSFTVSQLRSLKVRCCESNICMGNFSLVLHYPVLLEGWNKNIEKNDVCCFLSDQFGNSVKEIHCEELTFNNQRKDVEVVLPSGETVVLQKVLVRKCGFIVIKLNECEHTNPISFSIEETFLLCAPAGTKVKCEVLEIECNAKATSSDYPDVLLEIEISIDICQRVSVLGNVQLMLDCQLAEPRQNLILKG